MRKTLIAIIMSFLIFQVTAYAEEVSSEVAEAQNDAAEVVDSAKETAEEASSEAASEIADEAEEEIAETAEKAEEAEAEMEEALEEAEENLEDTEEAAREIVEEKQADVVVSRPIHKSNELLGYDVAKYTTLGVGLGLVATGVAFGILAQKDQDDYNEKYAKYSIVDEKLHDDATKKALISTSTYVAGGVVLGASITLFILDALDVGESPLRKFGFAPILGPKTQGASVLVRY